MRPLLEKLRDDPAREVRDVVAQAGVPVDDPVSELEEAADGWLARDPEAVVHLVSRAAADAPLSTLHRLIEKVRSKESEGRAARRRDWGAVRGALHVALARRASKVALYDLREALERTRDPLPPDYLMAMGLIGDASCLEPLAVAFVQAHAMEDADLWRRDVASVFRQIVEREGLTRRHGPSAACAPAFATKSTSSCGSASVRLGESRVGHRRPSAVHAGAARHLLERQIANRGLRLRP